MEKNYRESDGNQNSDCEPDNLHQLTLFTYTIGIIIDADRETDSREDQVIFRPRTHTGVGSSKTIVIFQ